MPALEIRSCSRCGATAPQVALGQLVSEPEGWQTVTLTGLPVCNRRLCPACAREIRTLIHTSPIDMAAAREADRRAAWQRGYEDGRELLERDPTSTALQVVG